MNKLAIPVLSLAALVAPTSTQQHNRDKVATQTNNTEVLVNTRDANLKCLEIPAFAVQKPVVEVARDTITQGEAAVVTVKTKHELKDPYCAILNSEGKKIKMPLYKDNDSVYSAIVGSNPYTPTGTHKIYVGDESYSLSDSANYEVKKGNFATQSIDFSPSVKRLHATSYEKNKIRGAVNKISREDCFEMPPYDLPTHGTMTTEYGAMRPYFHNGLDIKAPNGQPIKSILAGKVLVAEKFPMNGGAVIIQHGRFKSIYLHMSKFAVKAGDVIKKGQIIGKVGSTGHSSGPHLHFEMMSNDGVAINPLQFVKGWAKDPKLKLRMLKSHTEASVDSVKNLPNWLKPAEKPSILKVNHLQTVAQKALKTVAKAR